MIIDELISLIGFKVDERGAAQARAAFEGVQRSAETLAQVLGGAGLAAGFVKLVEFGHAAAETMDRLDTLFGPSAEEVKAWSDSFGKEVGRSRSELRQMVATLGGVLGPLGITGAAAADMGQTLSELAVSLAELNNTDDAQALDALRAALTGSERALRRFGVVLEDQDMVEAARALGIRKSVKALNEAERAQVSYQAILTKTADVARAGLDPTEALEARIKNLRDTVGLLLLPIGERLANVAIRLVDWFEELAEKSSIVQAAFAVLVPVVARAALAMAAPFLPTLAVLALVALAVDDLITLFRGGDSAVGRFLDTLGGAGTAAETVRVLREAWADFVTFAEASWPTVQTILKIMGLGFNALLGVLKSVGVYWGNLIYGVAAALSNVRKAVADITSGNVASALAHLQEATKPFVIDALGKGADALVEEFRKSSQEAFKLVASLEPVRRPPPLPTPSNNSRSAQVNSTVINNFNGVRASDIDARVRDAGTSAGSHVAQQLRNAAAAGAR